MALRLRTLPEAMNEIKAMDSNTQFTLSTLRMLVRKGVIPAVHIRNRQLVNMDVLIDFLSGETQMKQATASSPAPVEQEQDDSFGKIRKVVG